MKKINLKLKWLLVILPLTGCSASIPLNSPNDTVIYQPQSSSIIKSKENNAEVKIEKVEIPRTSNFKTLDIPEGSHEQKILVSRPVNIDPSVKLIAPPTGLPNTTYVVPKVEEKENYVPPVTSVKCVIAKGKKICKKIVKNKTSSIKPEKTLNKNSKNKNVAKIVSKNSAKTPVKKTEKNKSKEASPAKKKN